MSDEMMEVFGGAIIMLLTCGVVFSIAAVFGG